MGERGIQIQESAVGSAIVSGDGNVVTVIYQVIQQSILKTAGTSTKLGPNPYRGLAAFTEKDSDRYFGREDQINRLWEAFQSLVERSGGPRLLTVLGPSGCGKSSLVRAGLIPALAQRPLLGKKRMRVAVMVPGEHPLEALAGVLAKAVTENPMPVAKNREFTEELAIPSASGEYDGLRRITALMPEIRDSPLVVLVDQFEEIYTNEPRGTTPEEHSRRECFLQERTAFIENLLCAAKDSSGNLSVILTLRSDFLGETQRHPDLNQAISHQEVIVPAMTAAELARAIAEPAKREGYPFEDVLVDRMVQDMAGQEGALPLLQFALTKLWEELSQESLQRRSPLQVYLDIGGIGGAVADRADKIFDGLKDAGSLKVDRQAIAQRIFLSLVQPGGENNRVTRRRIKVKDLATRKISLEQVREVIHEFSKENARLITLSTVEGEVTAEVTHEALFETWQRFKDWIRDRWDDIRLQQRLEEAASHWDEQGRPAGLLWRFPDLSLLRAFVRTTNPDLNTCCLDFFHASDRAERQQRRLKRLGVAGLAAGLMLTTSLSAFAGYQVWRAERRQVQIYEIASQSLAETDPLDAMVNGLAAIGLGRNPLVKLPQFWEEGLVSTTLLDLPNRHARFNHVSGYVGWFISVALSSDGETVVSGGRDGTLRLWDRAGQSIGQPFTGHEGLVMSVALSPNGETIVSGGEDGKVWLWDRAGQPIGQPFTGHEGTVNSVALSQDGETVVSGGSDGTVRLWDRAGQPIGQPFTGHEGTVNSVALSQDGETVVSGGEDGKVWLWDRAGQPIGQPFTGHEGSVQSVALGPDGETVASGGMDGSVRLWDRVGQPIGQPFVHEAAVWSVALSPDGKTVVSSGMNRTVRLWDRVGQPIGQPFVYEAAVDWVTSVALSPDGKTLVGGGFDGTIWLWDRAGQPIGQPFTGHEGKVISVALSQDGETTVGGGVDGTVRLWDRAGQPIGQPFTGHEGSVISVALSPDGETVVSGGEDGTVRLWDRAGQPIGQPFTGHENWATSVASSPDGETIVSGGLDGTVRLWDRAGQPIGQPFTGHEGKVNSVALSQDGETVVSGGSDGTVRLWDRAGQPIGQPFTGHENWVTSVALSPDGETVVSGGMDGTVRLWNRAGQPLEQPFTGHEGLVQSVALSPDGKTVVSDGRDGTVRLWDRAGQPLGLPFSAGQPLGQHFTGHEGTIMSVDLSPDGGMVVVSSFDDTVRMWPMWLLEQGWVTYTCDRIRGYLVVNSDTDETVRIARRTCERFAWR